MSNFFLTFNSVRSSLYSKKWLRFVLIVIVFGVSFIFFSIVESLVITLIFFSIFSGKGGQILTGGALVFLILIPILQILDQYAGFLFPLFDGEELAVGVFYLLCISVIFEIIGSFVKPKINPSFRNTDTLIFSPEENPILLPHTIANPTLLKTNQQAQPLLTQKQETREFILVPKSVDSLQKANSKPTVINVR
jgi:hypothetical protein